LDGAPTRPRVRPPDSPATEPAPARYRQRRVLAVGAAALAVLLTAGAVALTGRHGHVAGPAAAPGSTATRSSGADLATGVIRLEAPQDAGSSVRLTWTGPAGLTYAVIVAEPDKPARPVFVGTGTTKTVPVDPSLRY